MLMRFNLDEKYRHYKKDSRFVMDLYTITYDTHERLENLPTTHLPEIHDFHKRRLSASSTNRDEIRRRLASGESFDWKGARPGGRPLGGAATPLQVCFMNETASDDDADDATAQSLPFFDLSKPRANINKPAFNSGPRTHSPPRKHGFSQFLPPTPKKGTSSRPPFWGEEETDEEEELTDFFSQQAKLQGEARQALAAAREIVKLQLSQERILRPRSPVAEMVGNSLQKSGGGASGGRRSESKTLPLSALPRRLTAEFLGGLNLNLAQLEVIVNDFHSHVEELNASLVGLLVERDDLNMEQDSMLVDVEDLTRYLAAKHNSEHQSLPLLSASQSILGKKK